MSPSRAQPHSRASPGHCRPSLWGGPWRPHCPPPTGTPRRPKRLAGPGGWVVSPRVIDAPSWLTPNDKNGHLLLYTITVWIFHFLLILVSNQNYQKCIDNWFVSCQTICFIEVPQTLGESSAREEDEEQRWERERKERQERRQREEEEARERELQELARLEREMVMVVLHQVLLKLLFLIIII